MERNKRIIQTSIIGIFVNVFLAAFKAVVGALSGSIAVILDAVNNLSDALSSVITIIGTKLAGKQPDKKHPYGYGRIEYLSALIIAFIVLYAGITSFSESVKKIMHPITPDYSRVGLVIIAVAVAAKIILGRYVKKVGEEVNSDSLIASGEDAMLDSVISASTLVAAGIFLTWNISLEAWLGAIISIIIIKSGLEMVRDTLSEILGERVDAEITKAVRKTVIEFEDVHGAYDLILHNYGPDKLIGSVHIEVPDTYTMNQLDILERKISRKVYEEHGVALEGIGIYSVNTQDDAALKLRNEITRVVMQHEHVLQMHGFYYNEIEKSIHFDIIIDFDVKDRKSLYQKIFREVQEKHPGYQINIVLDTDISD